MESSIDWNTLIESTEDPFSLEVAEEFIGCILTKQSSRMINLPNDIKPLDDERLDVFKTANKSRVRLIRVIIDKIKNNVNSSYGINKDIFNESFSTMTNEEFIQLMSFTDKDIEEIFIDGKTFECSDNFKNMINEIYEMTNMLGEHTGSSSIFKTKNPNEKADTRIYLNTPVNRNGFNFLTEFAEKCINRGILHDMKGFDKYDNSCGKDRTVIYGHSECFLDQIEILEEIAKEHPEWIHDFGTPIHTGGSPMINSNKEWYSIGYTPTNPRTGKVLMQTYNDFIDFSGVIGFGSAICQSISDKTKEILRGQYNKISHTNISSKAWGNIIEQMAALSSENSRIIVGINSFELNSDELNISENDFAHFLAYNSIDNLEETFRILLSEDSMAREQFLKRFKMQTEKVISRALGKEKSPIYMSPKLASEYSNRKENDYKKEDEVRTSGEVNLPRSNGFRVPNEEDLTGFPKSNGFRKATDFDR